ncbi:hypothetical protein Bca101_066562 [Brassica carinata]
MKPFNSNLKAKVMVKANEAERSDIDHLEHILGKHWDVRDGSKRERLEKLSSSEDKSNGVGAVEAAMLSLSVEDESKGEETEKAILSLSEAAEKIDPSHFAAFMDKLKAVPETDLVRINGYLVRAFSQVPPLPWFNMIKKSPLSDVPFSHIPKSVYETTTVDWINKLPFKTHWELVTWALDRLLLDWVSHARGEEQPNIEYQVGTLVQLAMVLRATPDSLTCLLPMLRGKPKYHGQEKLPLIVWMMSQAFHDDLPAALYSWALNLLPLVVNDCYSSHSIDLILQFVEMILSSNPEARAVLLNEPVRHGERLIPPCSFEMLVRLTFPAPSARIFTFSLKLAGGQGIGGNPALANEATAIAISVLTQNVNCFKQWDVLYKENLEASVALLNKLVDEWKDHSLILSSSSSDTLTVKHAMNSFRMKNEKAITEGVANPSLYKEADQSCKLISRRLSHGIGIAPLTAMVIAAAGSVVGAGAAHALIYLARSNNSANALKQIFTFSLKLAGGQGNPALANEATAIAISVLTQNVDCFKQWDVLYMENLEASVSLLKNLVDEWKVHSLKLSSSPSDTLTVKHAMNSFRMKNEKAITEGVTNLSLYKEAEKSCKLISRRLSCDLRLASLTAMWSPTSRGPPEQTTKAENLSGKEVTGEREASAGVEKADAGEPQLHRRQRADEEMAPR